jgi:hypothetical protein
MTFPSGWRALEGGIGGVAPRMPSRPIMAASTA